MSELELTDLICESRRRNLTERELRRLEDLVSTNLDARLMQLMQPELERVSRVQPGDDVICTRIAEQALQSAGVGIQCQRVGAPGERTAKTWVTGKASRLRRPVWLLAAAIVLGATGVGAWWAPSKLMPARVSTAEGDDSNGTGVRHVARGMSATRHTSVPFTPKSAPSTEAVPAEVTERERNASVEAEENAQGVPAQPNQPEEKQRKCRDCDRAHATNRTSASMFAQANLLRREGHTTEALQLYRRILAAYPTAQEGSLARLVLAKALLRSNPRQALAYNQEVAKGSGPLRAEALWGVVEAATLLNQATTKQQALSQLMHEFPDSAYAEVARQGMKDAVP